MEIKHAFVSLAAAFWAELQNPNLSWFAVVCWILPLAIFQEQNIV